VDDPSGSDFASASRHEKTCFVGLAFGGSISPEWGFSFLNQYLGEIRPAVKLSHAQVVFGFCGEEDRGNQRLQFLTGKCFAVGAVSDAPLFGTGSSHAFLVCDLPIAWAAVAFHVLCSIHLMTEQSSPSVNESLPHRRVFGSSSAKVAVVAAITYHLCAFIQHVLLRLYDLSGLPRELSGKLDPCESVLSDLLCISLGASHFRMSRCPDSHWTTSQKAYERRQMFEVQVPSVRRL
jgi:hypothetical protein